MNSVERVVEYMPLPAEAPAVIEGHRPPAAWPSGGAISVEGLVVRYRPELPPVINSLSFSTKAKEKVPPPPATHCCKYSFTASACLGFKSWLGCVWRFGSSCLALETGGAPCLVFSGMGSVRG